MSLRGRSPVTLTVFLADYNAEVTLTLPAELTSTEVSLLRLLIQGMSVSEIARKRCRSVKTISIQKAQLYQKLGVRNDLTLWLDMLFRYKPGLKTGEEASRHQI
ncbi:helix-turn-helix transcriptional regulator [Citrobacter sp. TSA-1]|uniref:helix-turn-helix domain-containing protein n=1 Tax=Citrobacter sp. TSA-1 TaxID=184912 RepID=UPI000BAE509A|nr:LuxR C-terminal-related transcriptional regulator [Citrobacter sp. TSA-1]PAX77555.1 helix-turn-helix transcriptional regulator [Citrobacter sp. TSA-1]QKE22685.1 response regulator transcription factor [Citrobacter sp. TSA-1]